MPSGYSLQKTDVVIVVLGIAVGVALGSVFLQAATPSSPDVTPEPGVRTFTLPVWPATYLFTWGIETGAVAEPEGVEFDLTALAPNRPEESPNTVFVRGETDIALVQPYQVPAVLNERPDSRILPYVVTTTPEMHNLVVPSDSSITDPSQLAGERIAMTPEASASALLLIALEEQYGVNTSTIEIVKTQNPPGALDDGTASAALFWRLPDARYRSIMRPFTYFREEYGENASFDGFIVVQDASDADAGPAIVQTLIESGKLGVQNVSAIADYYQGRQTVDFGSIDRLLSTIASSTAGNVIVPMTEDHQRGIQRLYDRAYEEGITEYEIDVSERIVSE